MGESVELGQPDGGAGLQRREDQAQDMLELTCSRDLSKETQMSSRQSNILVCN